MNLRQRITTCTLLACVLASAHAAAASIPSTTLEQLSSPQFEARETATYSLLADNSITSGDIAQAYQLASDPEQRNRLLLIARHHLTRRLHANLPQIPGQPGAMGLLHQPVTPDQSPQLTTCAVRVVQTYPGFPAYAYLRPGDLILSVDNEPMKTRATPEQISEDFQAIVRRKLVGERIDLAILRDGKTLKVSFPLAAMTSLREMYEQNTGQLEPRYREIWEKAEKSLVGPAAAPLKLERNDAASPASRSSLEETRQLLVDTARTLQAAIAEAKDERTREQYAGELMEIRRKITALDQQMRKDARRAELAPGEERR